MLLAKFWGEKGAIDSNAGVQGLPCEGMLGQGKLRTLDAGKASLALP
jgi:hypothetical protein